MSKQEFRVQYKDSAGVWCAVGLVYYDYDEALTKLLEEAKNDPEYTHRIVRINVVGYITGQGEFDE